MAPYGPKWPKIPALQGLLQQNYGLIRLAKVYGLWFTRERSKVRSLVRPPFKSLSSLYAAACLARRDMRPIDYMWLARV
jgi:hypothetical protein